MKNRVVVIIAMALLSSILYSQEKQEKPQQEKPPQEQETPKKEKQEQKQEEGRKRSWEMPEITVYGEKPLQEEQLIGDYKQPRWTARRRFPTTRVYVIPEGKVEFEWWWRFNAAPRNTDGQTEIDQLYEIEVGLPHRFQLDLYQGVANIDKKGKFGSVFRARNLESIELRWALADWGKIWGNPALYAEYTKMEGADQDKGELKLLLGDELAPRWHWGFNLVREWSFQDVAHRVEENELTGGLAYSLIDSKLSVGIEAKASVETSFGSPGVDKGWIRTLKVGPSIQWKPLPTMNIQFAPLIGIDHNSEKYQIWLILGWEF